MTDAIPATTTASVAAPSVQRVRRMGGVLLVFSYLIIPAVCANLFAASLRTHLVVGWIVATLSSVAGLYTSYRFDLPTGAAIVCSLGLALLLAGVGRGMTFIMKR